MFVSRFGFGFGFVFGDSGMLFQRLVPLCDIFGRSAMVRELAGITEYEAEAKA
jgi:hypothetical protein